SSPLKGFGSVPTSRRAVPSSPPGASAASAQGKGKPRTAPASPGPAGLPVVLMCSLFGELPQTQRGGRPGAGGPARPDCAVPSHGGEGRDETANRPLPEKPRSRPDPSAGATGPGGLAAGPRTGDGGMTVASCCSASRTSRKRNNRTAPPGGRPPNGGTCHVRPRVGEHEEGHRDDLPHAPGAVQEVGLPVPGGRATPGHPGRAGAAVSQEVGRDRHRVARPPAGGAGGPVLGRPEEPGGGLRPGVRQGPGGAARQDPGTVAEELRVPAAGAGGAGQGVPGGRGPLDRAAGQGGRLTRPGRLPTASPEAGPRKEDAMSDNTSQPEVEQAEAA